MKKIIFVILVIFFGISFFQKDKLPNNRDVPNQIYQEPIQTETDKQPFEIEKEGLTYKITPLYNYEFYGLIVSYHNAKSWADAYHNMWGDYINTKDICVIWGDNVKNEVYKLMKFKNGSFTCYASAKNYEIWSKFQMNALSNNHLLSGDKNVASAIASAKMGDTVYLKGYLVNYSYSNKEGNFTRGTSITREDTENGACETIYVTNFEILKKANPFWNILYNLTKYSIIIYIIALLISFFWPKKYNL